MDGTGQDEDSSVDAALSSAEETPVIQISPAGDVVLDVSFENSAETIRNARRTYQAALKKPSASPRLLEPDLRSWVRVAFRVELSVLRKHSKYFDNLLGNTQFAEARLVRDSLSAISGQHQSMRDVDVASLPWIPVADDDEATRSVGREKVFEDMLRILHGQPVRTGLSLVTMLYVTTLAIFADRFDCQAPVSRYLTTGLKFKWPLTSNRSLRADAAKNVVGTEKLLRQKILVAWLLEQPPRLSSATREIIIRGSSRWGILQEEDEGHCTEAWWDLPDDLELELQYRREAVLNTIASVQRYFFNIYSSRERQCKLGYDSSSACDFFQLGQMLKFFTSKELLNLVDFGPSSLDALPDSSMLDIDELLFTLRQCPHYQVDKNHANCGLRTRLEPIVDFIQAMLSSNVLSISHAEWKNDRVACSWLRAAEARDPAVSNHRPSRFGSDNEDGGGKFEFTRSMAADPRLRTNGAMFTDKLARKLFTAQFWDWSPEY